MEQKVYEIENLCCANCAAKIEAKFNELPEVESAVIVFPTKQLRLTAADPDGLIDKLTALARTVEPDVAFHSQEHHHHEHHEGCSCGHHHEHHEGCACGHDHHEHHEGCACGHDHHEHHEGCACGHDHHHEHEHSGDSRDILMGALLFLFGLVLDLLGHEIIGKAAFALAYLVLGREVLTHAVKNLIRGRMLDENFLMSIATLGALCINEFPEAVGVMLFYRIGEFFEEKAVARSRSQIMDAVDLRPEVVQLIRGMEVRTIPAADARPGDRLLVRPGDRIPLDGVVINGDSRIDTAPITGEPVPVHVTAGSEIISGCINGDCQLIMEVRRPLEESMVTRILHSVENAAASKPKIDRFITRFARVYTPVVVGLALIVAIVPSIFTGDWNYWVYTALSFLVMSCPCALVLSVPLAFFSGIGAGSRKGILFKGGASIEAMGKVRAVVMDKTGTLTKGDFRVQEILGDSAILPLCASCEQQSSHPIAQSIVAAAKEKRLKLYAPESLEEISGKGIRASLQGKAVLCGNEALMEQFGVEHPAESTGFGTRVLVAVSGQYVGSLVISDTIKDGAADAVTQLKKKHLTSVMLTGDSADAAQAIANTVGIGQVHARLLPEEKLERLQEIRAKHGAVMFVGDGINDAPVLAGADVGAAMGSGADAAIEAADVVFMTGDPRAIPEALAIAARTARTAWQNVYFALAVKAIAMVLGLLGFASMWIAVFADSGVAMICVLNSIRMLYRRK